MDLKRVLSYVWALPNTLLGAGILIIAFPLGARARLREGVLEIEGRPIRFLLTRAVPLPGGALALTIGHVVLGISESALDASRDHERAHVRQYERWGPLFIPAYLVASGVAWARGRRPYRDNVFEKEAYDAEEGTT